MQSLTVIQWVAVGLGIALAISEALPFSDSIKANGIFQGIIAAVKAVIEALKKPVA